MEYKFENIKAGARREPFIKEIKDTFIYLFPIKKENISSVKPKISRPGTPGVTESFPRGQANFFQRLWVAKKTVIVLSTIAILLIFSTFLFLKLRSSFVLIEGNYSYVKQNQGTSP